MTTALLVTLFGGFFIVNTICSNYWNDIEIVEMLDWIAYSGIFTPYNEEVVDDEKLIWDITKDENPIAGITVDEEGNVLSCRVIGNETRMEIPDSIIEKMCEKGNEKRKIGKYYYSYSKLNDGTALLVVMNSVSDKVSGSKVLGIFLLVFGGIFLLELIIIWLSRFVTGPAEQTLLREKQFISDAGHELKTPLGAISINAQALEPELKDNLYIKNILSESKRMERLLEKLLILAKYDEQDAVVMTKINVSEICEEMALTYESVVYEKKIKFEYKIYSNVEIIGSEDEIRQLLAILIDNGIKNTEEDGHIGLTCSGNRRHCEISVSNTGEGISEEVMPHLFDRFYTSDKSRTKGSFGLGLAIAKSIVERHKGTIKVESMHGEKTVFRVLI